MYKLLLAGAVIASGSSFARSQVLQHGLRVPAGFEVTEYADHRLANDIYCLTIDAKGRVFVSGRGYVRILVDDDDDGKADRAMEFANEPKDGAMGLLCEGDTVYVTGDGGLRKLVDADDDGKADGPSTLIRAMKTGGEHAAHDIRRGPEGWLYVLCGNHAGIDHTYGSSPRSPIRDPVAGCVLRFPPNAKESEIVAHGFRNPYGMDFNTGGELFTFDSDNERCVSLPWYEPTRFYHVSAGQHYGWLSPQRANFWRLPPYFPDVTPPVATLGRGSPTGIACYRHTQFPREYRGSFFLCDWTFGKVFHAPLQRQGTTYTSRPKVFLEAVGDNGFAPTGIAVHPRTGDLFISIGGRGTRGAVYRIRYPTGFSPDRRIGIALPKSRPPSLEWPSTSSLRPIPDARLEQLAAQAPTSQLTDAVRMVQLALGDIGSPKARGTFLEGYSLRKSEARKESGPWSAILRKRYPSGDANADREILRTLAMLGAEVPAGLPRRWTRESDPLDDIHELICWAQAANEDRQTARVARALLELDRKIAQRRLNRDSHWPLRIAELFAALAQKDPSLPGTLVAHADFGRPDHALFVPAAGEERGKAATIFLAKLRDDAAYPVNEAVLNVLRALPAGVVNPVVRGLWGRAGQDAAVVALLTRQPEVQDRAKFVQGLASPQAGNVASALTALEKLPLTNDGQEVLNLLRAWRQFSEQPKELRTALRRRLAQVTGLPTDSDDNGFTAWFTQQFPELATRLTNPDGVDLGAWQQRLARIDKAPGDAARGQAVFAKANCAACHSGNQAIGPDLKGVAKRFARPDLFTAMIQPSKEVPARYQTTQVETRDGKLYQGVVIYDAVDSLILQTAATSTVRLAGTDVAWRQTVSRSLMPAGLLDPLTDAEIADLLAYLQGE